MEEKQIRENIEALKSTITFLENLLNNVAEKDNLLEFTQLRNFLRSKDWPAAVPQNIFNENEEQAATRTLHEIIKTEIKDKKFLEYGCANGFIPYVTEKLGANSIGFDPEKQDWSHFDFSENFLLTNQFELVQTQAPYDVILINGFLEFTKNPEEVIKNVKELLSETGEIYLRICPWTNRHATYSYKKMNKAYLHLIFAGEELYKLGVQPLKIIPRINSINYYKSIITNQLLKIKEQNITTEHVEVFFTHQHLLMNRIKENLKKLTNEHVTKKMLETQYVDLILQK